jgi:hypothetical protein
MLIPAHQLDDPDFLKSWEVFQSGRYLLDVNMEIWILIDEDQFHLTYVKDIRSPSQSLN